MTALESVLLAALLIVTAVLATLWVRARAGANTETSSTHRTLLGMKVELESTRTETRSLREQLDLMRNERDAAHTLAREEREQGARALAAVRQELAAELTHMRAIKDRAERDLAALTSTVEAQKTQIGHLELSLGDEKNARCVAEDQRTNTALLLAESNQKNVALQQQLAELPKRESDLASMQAKLSESHMKLTEKVELAARLQVSLEQERTASAEKLEQERRSAEQKLELYRELQTKLEEKFNGLAAQVLERNTEKFETHTKLRLNDMAEAVAKQVRELQQKVEQTHSQDVHDRIALRTELQKMVEASRRIDQDAANLTRALTTDRKTQGAWGELVLDRILEQCGLRPGVEYERQAVLSNDDDERLRPDVIVKLPGKRSVVIDAKVALTAYNEFVAAEDDAQASDARQRHVSAVRTHIKTLAGKEYWRLNGLDTGDYVLMFLPIESAFAEALRAAPGLFEEGFAHQVVLTSPATLVATLRTIEHSWRVERQNATARSIVEQAGRLYDKMAGFVEDLKKVGASLDAAQRAYSGAYNKLSSGKGNLVGQADRLRELGVKLKKALPAELTDQARLNDAATDDEVYAADPDESGSSVDAPKSREDLVDA